MLDPWIIEEILKREEEARQERDRARVDLPLDTPGRMPEPTVVTTPPEDRDRGVVVIDI